QNPFGVIETNDEKIIDLFEKPTYNSLVNGGVYVLSEKAKSLIPETFYNMTSLFEELIEKNEDIFAYNMFENWNDIANVQELNSMNSKQKKIFKNEEQ
ncbi:sugar phosphate nucleotidyltransferase, partial [Schleiferiaceae bacterium]|nr:sugar phosphate nucleotidyltransferase [Schleiferiaceae bacterium]